MYAVHGVAIEVSDAQQSVTQSLTLSRDGGKGNVHKECRRAERCGEVRFGRRDVMQMKQSVFLYADKNK